MDAVGGAVTYHLIDNGAASFYTQKLSPNGRLIFNEIYGLNLLFESKKWFFSIGGFGGNNSVGLPIEGGLIAWGLKFWTSHCYLGWALGGYFQSDKDYRAKGVIPVKLFEIKNNQDFVPLVGIEFAVKFMITDSFYFKIYELLTPVLNINTAAVGLTL